MGSILRFLLRLFLALPFILTAFFGLLAVAFLSVSSFQTD